jgi:1,4-dihydroxy-2-naphthoate octaprenyltransferase
VKEFLIMSRAPFFTAIIIPVLFANALVYNQNHSISWLYLIITLLGLIFAQAGSNLLNDYFDTKLGADLDNPNRSQFSGGSGKIADGSISSKKILYYAIISFIIAIASGVYLLVSIDKGINFIFYFMLIGFLLGYFYTAPPFKLAYRGLGEISIFITFGVLPIMGSFYIQTKEISLTALLASLPLSFLITNIIWINEFPDYESDKNAGKKQLVVRMGIKKARHIYTLFLSLAVISLILLIPLKILPLLSLISLIIIPLALITINILYKNYDKPKNLIPGQGLTILTHILFGILLIISLIL